MFWARRRTMATILRYTTCLVIVLNLTIAMRGVASTDVPDPALRDAVEELRKLYATEVTLGKPLEIDEFKIIPLATVGIGYGQRTAAPGAEALQGAGGVLSPVGVLVVSNRGVQLLPVSKGLLEQLLGAVTPVLLQIMKGERRETANATGTPQARVSLLDLLATLYAFLPESGWKFGWFPWPLPLVLIFLSGWLVLALLIGVFLPQLTITIAATLRADVLRAGLVGLLSYGVVFILAAVFTISIIGIPLTLVLLVFIWAAKLMGTVSIAWLVGQKTLTAARRTPHAEVTHVLIGGIILGLVRIIPVLGWILWLILGIFGFGAVLRTQVQR
jgi:uncharacterized spore protein YtfJ